MPGFDPYDFEHTRKSVRYKRDDIKVSLSGYLLFSQGRPLDATLLDVSAKGVQVYTPKKLWANKKLVVHLEFADGRKFDLKAKIMRHKLAINYRYKLEFLDGGDALEKRFRLGKTNTYVAGSPIEAEYHNFGVNSVEMLTPNSLGSDDKLSLILDCGAEEQQELEAKIVCQDKLDRHCYGLKFESPNDDLGEHILNTQTRLLFG